MFCFDTMLGSLFVFPNCLGSGRMSQNIINNWENLDRDCELLNLGKLMSQKQSNVCFNSSHLISTITTTGTRPHCCPAWSLRTVQDSAQDFPMTRRSTTTKQLSLMRPSQDLHKKLYCLIDMDLLTCSIRLDRITDSEDQTMCTCVLCCSTLCV